MVRTRASRLYEGGTPLLSVGARCECLSWAAALVLGDDGLANAERLSELDLGDAALLAQAATRLPDAL